MQPAVMDNAGRLLSSQASLSETKVDCLLIAHLPNIHDLCGFTGSAAALIVGDRGSVFFTDGRYRTQARGEVKGASIVIVRKSPLLAPGQRLAPQRGTTRQRSLGFGPRLKTAVTPDR